MKGALLLILAFGLGCVTGGVALTLAQDRAVWWGTAGRADRFERTALRRLTQELRLRPEQAAQVEAVLRETGQEFRRLRDEIAPRFGALRRESVARVRAVLDPEQQEKFSELVTQWDRRIERWHDRKRGGP
jgi:Spy/CpxP family protein refolding chaperone